MGFAEQNIILFIFFMKGGLFTHAKSEAALPEYLVVLAVVSVFVREKTRVLRMLNIAFGYLRHSISLKRSQSLIRFSVQSLACPNFLLIFDLHK